MNSVRPVFLDRDGVINVDRGYVHRWDDFEFVPGVSKGLRQLSSAGHPLVVVTNQSGIGRGYFSETEFEDLTRRMRAHLTSLGISLTAVYHCPHHPEATVESYRRDCDCRKPAPGLLFRAADQLNLDLSRAIMVGDSARDLESAARAGVPHRILLGQPKDMLSSALATFSAPTFADATEHILGLDD